jgi:hypothetical protein
MSTMHYPDDFDVDYHADLQWQRAQMALKTLEVGDVIATVEEILAEEPNPERRRCQINPS